VNPLWRLGISYEEVPLGAVLASLSAPGTDVKSLGGGCVILGVSHSELNPNIRDQFTMKNIL
jgi:hypothetical protein